MNIINLEDAKVSYEGQTLPAIHLIVMLQTQLREAAGRMAAIAETLGDLQTALLNSHTVEVKLTLSKDDYDKFKSLGGMDDNERIRKALMDVIHPKEAQTSSDSDEPRPATPFTASSPEPASGESQPAKSSDPLPSPAPEPPVVDQSIQEQPIALETPIKRKLITKCPTCQALIDLPDTSNDLWPVELKCGNCGSKCLLKPSFRKP